MKSSIFWLSTPTPGLFEGYCKGVHVQKKGLLFSVGKMETAFIKFGSETLLIKFLTK